MPIAGKVMKVRVTWEFWELNPILSLLGLAQTENHSEGVQPIAWATRVNIAGVLQEDYTL